MTDVPVSQEAVEMAVTDADKEASAELAHAIGMSCEDFTSGGADVIVQALARHRQQAERDTLARIEWRDIESAPKDWTDVLVFSPEHEGFNCGGVFSAFYDTDEACWFTHAPGHNIRLNPTHWMPLPPAPEAGQ